MNRGQFPKPCCRPRLAGNGLERPSGRNPSAGTSHHIMSPTRSHPESSAEVSMGVRGHTTAPQRAHAPPAKPPSRGAPGNTINRRLTPAAGTSKQGAYEYVQNWPNAYACSAVGIDARGDDQLRPHGSVAKPIAGPAGSWTRMRSSAPRRRRGRVPQSSRSASVPRSSADCRFPFGSACSRVACQLTRRRNQGEHARCLPCRVWPAAEGCGPPAEDVAWQYERLLDGATAASAVALAGTAVTIFRSRFCNVPFRISYYICSEHFRIVTTAAGTAAGLRSGRSPGRGNARVLERRVPPHVGP